MWRAPTSANGTREDFSSISSPRIALGVEESAQRSAPLLLKDLDVRQTLGGNPRVLDRQGKNAGPPITIHPDPLRIRAGLVIDW